MDNPTVRPKGLETLISLALTDRKTREALKADLEGTAKRFSLSAEEVKKLKRMEFNRLDQLAWEVDSVLSKACVNIIDGACM